MAKVRTEKKVCLITPGHISSDPRLVKEAVALTESGLKVHLIFTQYVPYLVPHDLQILKKHPSWSYQAIDWTGTTSISKVTRILTRLSQLLSDDPAIKLNRNFRWQLKRSIACKADLYIAHNLGALPIAVMAAKVNKAKCGFDAEDFHRHETSDDIKDKDVILKTLIEEKYIPQLDHFTASSPQITDQYQSIFHQTIVTIVNVFPKLARVSLINNQQDTLNLFWFSQTIGPNRGLETVIEAMGISTVKIQFHLLGKPADAIYQKKLADMCSAIPGNRCSLYFYDPVDQDELFTKAQKFDIGLASEPGFCLNNKLALSNKLFTYIQSGLAVIASDTPAQKDLMQQIPDAGKLYTNAQQLAEIFKEYEYDRPLLHQTKKYCLELGQTQFNWEKESVKFINAVNNSLSA